MDRSSLEFYVFIENFEQRNSSLLFCFSALLVLFSFSPALSGPGSKAARSVPELGLGCGVGESRRAESGLWRADLSLADSGPADIHWKAFSIPSLNNNYGRKAYNLNIKILRRIDRLELLPACLLSIHPRPLVSADAP